jgi:hypothetical protein
MLQHPVPTRVTLCLRRMDHPQVYGEPILTLPTATTPVARSRRRRSRQAPVILVLLLVAGAVAGWYFLTRARLVLTNHLAAPIWVAVGTNAPVKLDPRAEMRAPVSRSGTLVVQWNLARPLSANERPMGEELRGSIVVREPRGTIYRTASARGVDADYFAPLITNASDQLLRVVVNAGLEGAVDCECAVRPGARRVFIGYYRLYQNSTVRARTGEGRAALFRDLGPSVTAVDGTVGLRFESKDLR